MTKVALEENLCEAEPPIDLGVQVSEVTRNDSRKYEGQPS